MSPKNSKRRNQRKKKDSLAKPQQECGNKNMSNDVNVRGRIEIDRSPSLAEQYRTERGEDDARQNKKYSLEKLTLLAVILYTGVTLILAILSVISINDSRKHFAKDQRPYLWVSLVDTEPYPIEANERLQANIYVVNYGKSPALRMVSIKKIFYGANAKERAYDWFDNLGNQPLQENVAEKSVSIVPPGIPVDPKHSPINSTAQGSPPLTITDVDFITQNDFSFYIVDRIDYYDLEGNYYRSEFCGFHLKTGALANCREHSWMR